MDVAQNDHVHVYRYAATVHDGERGVEEGSALSDSLYRVWGTTEDTWLEIQLSTENGGDRDFVRALKRKAKEARAVQTSRF